MLPWTDETTLLALTLITAGTAASAGAVVNAVDPAVAAAGGGGGGMDAAVEGAVEGAVVLALPAVLPVLEDAAAVKEHNNNSNTACAMEGIGEYTVPAGPGVPLFFAQCASNSALTFALVLMVRAVC